MRPEGRFIKSMDEHTAHVYVGWSNLNAPLLRELAREANEAAEFLEGGRERYLLQCIEESQACIDRNRAEIEMLRVARQKP